MRVFVAGLSRSGKTSRLKHAADSLDDVEYVSVSQLLRTAGGIVPVHTIADCLSNQRRALDALRLVPVTQSHQLVDGHALIETNEGPCLIPDWFFDEFAPDLIVYVHDLPEEILLRRRLSARPNNAAEIAALNLIELASCERIATRLGISLIALKAPSLEEFTDKLRQHIDNVQ